MMKIIGELTLSVIDKDIAIPNNEVQQLADKSPTIRYFSNTLLTVASPHQLVDTVEKLLAYWENYFSTMSSWIEGSYVIKESDAVVVVRTFLGHTYDVTVLTSTGRTFYGFKGLRDVFLNKADPQPKGPDTFKEVFKYEHDPVVSVEYWQTPQDAIVENWRDTVPARIKSYENKPGTQSTVEDYRNWLIDGIHLLLKDDIPAITKNPFYTSSKPELQELWASLIVANDNLKKAVQSLAVALQKEGNNNGN